MLICHISGATQFWFWKIIKMCVLHLSPESSIAHCPATRKCPSWFFTLLFFDVAGQGSKGNRDADRCNGRWLYWSWVVFPLFNQGIISFKDVALPLLFVSSICFRSRELNFWFAYYDVSSHSKDPSFSFSDFDEWIWRFSIEVVWFLIYDFNDQTLKRMK